MNYINESAKQIPLYDTYDTIVVGGGVAGIAAALASARGGAKTLLVEREYSLGGLATLGLVTIYLPLCDGMGRQCSFGIVEELLKLSIAHGAERLYPDAWLGENQDHEKRKTQRYEVQFNANLFALLAEKALLEAGVTIAYGTALATAKVEQRHITHLIFEAREGRFAHACKVAIDCTGDSILCREAGAPTAQYAYKNTIPAWYYYMKDGKNHLQMLGYAEDPNQQTTFDPSAPHVAGTDSREVSGMIQYAHQTLLAHFLARGNLTDTYALTAIGQIPQLRMTTRLQGAYTLDVSEDHKPQADSIGMISNWRKKGPIYEVPFGCLYTPDVVNLLVAGRNISVTDEMWDIARVIPPCAVTGEAAGTASTLFCDMTKADIPLLQATLSAHGVKLHKSELPPLPDHS